MRSIWLRVGQGLELNDAFFPRWNVETDMEAEYVGPKPDDSKFPKHSQNPNSGKSSAKTLTSQNEKNLKFQGI